MEYTDLELLDMGPPNIFIWLKKKCPPPLLIIGPRALGKTRIAEGIVEANASFSYEDIIDINGMKKVSFKPGKIYTAEKVPKIPSNFDGYILEMSLKKVDPQK